jgi:hypothetical protein
MQPNRSRFEIIAVVLGVLGVLLPMISFWWHLFAILVVALASTDLCLRESTLIPPYRVLLSLLPVAVLFAATWTPIRTQYEQEHLQPSFAYVAPYLWIDGSPPEWEMTIHHYGPSPITNAQVFFWDKDRTTATIAPHRTVPMNTWIQIPLAELDPSVTIEHMFQWVPVYPPRERYQIDSHSWDGKLDERSFREFLAIALVGDRWALMMLVFGQYGNPIIYCRDSNFPPPNPADIKAVHQAFPNLPPLPPRTECNKYLYTHQGDPQLPLKLPDDPTNRAMAIFVFFFALMVLLPLYGIFALWWMGESNLI